MITVEQLWAEKYAARHAAAEAEEGARRAEDFIEVTRTVCGFELRQLTPRDLLYLDYAGSPFIRGGEIGPAAIAQFLWQLCDPQPRGWWAERKFFRVCGALDYDAAVAQIRTFLDRTFADAPASASAAAPDSAEAAKPFGTNFVAPLIVRLAAGLPSLTPGAIMDTPLPQLFQYQKILAAEAAARSGGKFRERDPASQLLAQCLAEANRLNAEAQKFTTESTERTEVEPSCLGSVLSVPSVVNPDSCGSAP